MSVTRKLRHVDANLGNEDLGGMPADSGDGVQMRQLLAERRENLADVRIPLIVNARIASS
jgi:hypothetical protein